MKNLFITILCLFFAFKLSYGQDIQSSGSGFSVYGGLSYSSWVSESVFLSGLAELEPTGGGIKLGVAYGITEKVGVNLDHYSLSFANQNEWNTFRIAMQSLSARFTFGATLSKFRPFAEVGIARVSNRIDPVFFDGFDNLILDNTGFGLHLGGGLNFYINTNLAISLSVTYMTGIFSTISLSEVAFEPFEDVDFAVLNVNLGARYFFD